MGVVAAAMRGLAIIVGGIWRSPVRLFQMTFPDRVVIISVMIRSDRLHMFVRRAVEMGHGSAHRPVRHRQDKDEQG